MVRDAKQVGAIAQRYAALEMIAAELADEQPATAAQVREQMRELITQGGLRIGQPDGEPVLDARAWVS